MLGLLRSFSDSWPALIGSVCWSELRRTSRRAAAIWFRVGAGLVLLLVILVVYSIEFGVERTLISSESQTLTNRSMSRFGFLIVTVLLTCLYVGCILLTPLMTASVVLEEKQQRTLELLLMTHVPGYAIILGKVAARCLYLWSLLLLAGPILALAQFWGGIDGRLIALHTLVTMSAIVSLASLTVCIALYERHARVTVGIAYLQIGVLGGLLFAIALGSKSRLPLFVGLNMPWYVPELEDNTHALLWCGGSVGFHTLIAGLACLRASWVFRRTALEQLTMPAEREDLQEHALTPDRKRSPDKMLAAPPVGPDGLWWKECDFAYTLQRHQRRYSKVAHVEIALTVLAFCWLLTEAYFRGQASEDFILYQSIGLTIVTPIAMMMLMTKLMVRVSGCVLSERLADTLDPLLLLPVSREELFARKFWGNVASVARGSRALLGMLAISWLVYPFVNGLHPLAVPLLFVLSASHLFFAAALGMYASVVCAKQSTALWWSVGGFLALQFLVTIFGLRELNFLMIADGPAPRLDIIPALSVPLVWMFSLFSPVASNAHAQHRMEMAVFSTVTYGLAGGVAYLLARRRFAHEQTAYPLTPRTEARS